MHDQMDLVVIKNDTEINIERNVERFPWEKE